MLSIPVKKLREGMVVAQSVYSKAGAAFLVKGKPLTAQYIKSLEKIGIPSLSVTSTDPRFNILPPEDVVEEKTRLDAIQKVHDVFKDISEKKEMDPVGLTAVADKLISDIFARHENLIQLTDIRLYDAYTFAHSVNVAVLSAMLGKVEGISEADMRILVLGGLLHDLGKIKVPIQVLNKTGKLTAQEFEAIKAHPTEGFRRIHEFGKMLPKWEILAIIAAQHHEHMDGSGYPKGLRGDQLHRFAKIVAIADVYDALTSERPYKKAYTPSVAYGIMRTNTGHLEPELLEHFFDNVALYPIGAVLKTFYGYGIVTKCEFGHTRTPTIRVFANKKREVLTSPFTIDLKNDSPHVIEKEISGNELMQFTHNLSLDPSKYLA
ncbi:MAG: HD-GYP domain-containing protein [Schwartzia sp.]|nr:HD-GYP domain-containing protein [Schwartzia sp. (in: firmicutes)]MBR1759962.1 HD-GYP domain-containing protein [Schwartzia sp. (in: firmicutes)]